MKCRSLWKSIAFVALAACAIPTTADTRHAGAVSESTQLKSIVANLLQDNGAFVKSHGEAFFRPLIAGQAPRATVVTCSDSRVQTSAFDETSEGDLFMVRNIGNQLSTQQGSVEYGVHHLHTPLLIFIGHSSCGAIKAAAGNYRKESRAIRRELSTIRIPKGASGMNGVRINVNNQVAAAMKKFRHEVGTGELTVIGAIYDFSNELGQGLGKLNIININGDTDAAKIAASRLLNVLEKPSLTKNVITPGSVTAVSIPPSPSSYSYP